jgi:curved DNA-binding protein
VEAKLVIPLEKAYQGGIERVRLEGERIVEVEMPGGLVSGQKVRLRGQGIGGGDLYLLIEVLPHPLFRLQGIDIYCKIPITALEAILTIPIAVPTLDGLVEMKLPPGIRSGQSLRLGGKGYPTVEGSRGDQIVTLDICFPPQLTAIERNLYEQLYAIESFKPRQSLGSEEP